MDQLQLVLGELPVPDSALAATSKVPNADTAADKSATTNVVPLSRKSRHFPAHLPRETVVHAPANCGCMECGQQMRALGEDVSECLRRPELSTGGCPKPAQAYPAVPYSPCRFTMHLQTSRGPQPNNRNPSANVTTDPYRSEPYREHICSSR